MTKPKNAPRGKRGRPEHAPTPALRRKVSIAAGGGMLHEEIAMALGINRDTLRKHYRMELSVEAQKRRLEVLESVYAAAKRKGTSAAAKAYLAHAPEFEAQPIGEGEAPPAPPVPQPVAAAPAPRPAKLGKKEQAQADAHGAADGTVWDELLPKGTPLQ
jgi:hypothetical protein